MKPINSYKVVDIASALLAGLFLSYCFIDYYGKDRESPSVVYKTPDICKDFNEGGHVSYEELGNDLGLGSNKEIPLSLIIQSEDNFWEIEYYNGKYHRVVREDWEDIQGKYEYDEEEEIGNINDLENYANNIMTH